MVSGQHGKISSLVLGLDERIRFVGIVNQRGEVIEGGFNKNVVPLLDLDKEQQLYLESLSAISSLRNFSDSLGDVIYNVVEYKKVILLTFPLRESKILCISLSPGIDLAYFKNEVLKLMGSKC